jgi:uroporphyrinogen-III synthase
MAYPPLITFVYALLLQVTLFSLSDFSGSFAFVPRTTGQRTGCRAITSPSRTTLKASRNTVLVALTREAGKNGKLIDQIKRENELNVQLELLELPCIEHAVGPDYERLAEALLSKTWDYVAVTSPEAANVLASAWGVLGENPLPVAAVGKATEKSLMDAGIPVAFVPSKATAATLAAELDLKAGEGTTLLYPASARAKNTLERDLASRGFAVTRLNTYDTVTASWSPDLTEAGRLVQIACFASPSSVKGWLKNTGNNNQVLAACIGETSATACKELGWNENQIFSPEAPGLEGWVESIRQALEETIRVSHRNTSNASM